MRLLGLGLAALLLAACAGSRASLPVADAPEGVADTERVIVATTRSRDDDPLLGFSGGRSVALNFLDVDVSVPLARQPGQVIEPNVPPDPARQFAARQVRDLPDTNAFIAAINADMMQRPRSERVAFIFIHGYNVQFAAGVYRHAQLRHDYGFAALPVHYSWPSAGRLPGYLYDRDSVQFARDGLVETLGLISRSKAERVFLVAHSMGTLLAMEALRQISISGNTALLNKIEAVVLASPDIDVDVFQQQIAQIDPMPRPFVIFVSSRDRALKVSQRVRGGHARVGEGANIEQLRQDGFIVVDLSDVGDGTDRIRHSTFASSPSLIRMAQQRDLSRTILQQAAPGNQNAVQSGIGGVSDLAAAVIYLPAQVTGAR